MTPGTVTAGAPPTGAATAVLSCRRLRKSFDDVVVVDRLSLDIADGETYGLLGPNGAGKTTAMSLAAGILDA